ncbi:signal peptide peptidase SppA [Numidum massiliense]|uniref:signal peptide peptidase SppA n=1 Tax=Numidum massiliense TaxID=1522315 RepID=UPI0006D561B6|nr:signal peptide peptidase SppA [Numidum massiliense]
MTKKTWVWITVGCGILLVIGLVAGTLIVVKSGDGGKVAGDWKVRIEKEGGADRILLLGVDGVIMQSEDGSLLGAAGTSPWEVTNKLEQAVKDKRIKGIVVRVDSPGGDVVASDEIYHKLLQVKREQKLPIVFSFGSTAASGGYYVATAADKIFSNPLTLTGSIGVIMESYNLSELADKVGIKSVVIKSGKMKDIGSLFREMTKEERDVLQQLVDESYDRFVEVVATGRDLPEAEVRKIADGRVYTGQQAKKLKLVDELGTLDDAIAEAEKMAGIREATVVSYKQGSSLPSWLGVLGKDQGLSAQDLLERKSPGLMYLYTTD